VSYARSLQLRHTGESSRLPESSIGIKYAVYRLLILVDLVDQVAVNATSMLCIGTCAWAVVTRLID
jgi:hypothetical protein